MTTPSAARRILFCVLLAAADAVYLALIAALRMPLTADGQIVLAGMLVLDGAAAVAVISLASRPSVAQAAGWYALVRAGLYALLFSLPSAILLGAAALAVLSAPHRAAQGSASARHEYAPASAGWIGQMTPLNATRSLAGAGAMGSRACITCGKTQEDPIHWPAEA
jgi:hypothetical protein